MQGALAVAEDNHVVHVPDVMRSAKNLLDEVVHILQIEIGEHLGKQDADREFVAPPQDQRNEIKRPPVFDFPAQHIHENVNLDGWIELPHIHLQIVFRVLPVMPERSFDILLRIVDAASRNAPAGVGVDAVE